MIVDPQNCLIGALKHEITEVVIIARDEAGHIATWTSHPIDQALTLVHEMVKEYADE